MAPTNLDKALVDARAVFKRPEDVVTARDLTRAQKIEILRRWEYDAREIQVADEEGMTAPPPSEPQNAPLDLILKALRSLGAPSNPETSAPTKQGGS
jgi:hypothetical protein